MSLYLLWDNMGVRIQHLEMSISTVTRCQPHTDQSHHGLFSTLTAKDSTRGSGYQQAIGVRQTHSITLTLATIIYLLENGTSIYAME
jgi:hypothetical protein